MSKTVVAIVGRPNVGKSTLFNRIIQRRQAIIDDQPGVTRDRHYADAEWEGREFSLVDTGGFIPKALDVMEEKVTVQAQAALEEADIIVFLTDVITGITDIDDDVAKQLRKSGKQCIVAVNKVDNQGREMEVAQFNSLGLGDPVGISAMGGRGVGDLLSLIVSRFEDRDDIDTDDTASFKFAVVGRPNVGKSTFINTVIGKERHVVTDRPGTTRDAVDTCITVDNHDCVLVDTAGLRKKAKVYDNVEYYSNVRTQNALRRCEVAILFTDTEQGVTSQDMHILRDILEAKKGVVFVVNKWDRTEDDKDLSTEVIDSFVKLRGFEYVPLLRVSCKTRFNTKKILRTAIEVALERRKRVGAPELNRMLEELNRIYQPPQARGKRVRVMYGTQTDTDPPRFVFFSNYPALVSRNYQRFLENQIRSRFGFKGIPVTLNFRKK